MAIDCNMRCINPATPQKTRHLRPTLILSNSQHEVGNDNTRSASLFFRAGRRAGARGCACATPNLAGLHTDPARRGLLAPTAATACAPLGADGPGWGRPRAGAHTVRDAVFLRSTGLYLRLPRTRRHWSCTAHCFKTRLSVEKGKRSRETGGNGSGNIMARG